MSKLQNVLMLVGLLALSACAHNAMSKAANLAVDEKVSISAPAAKVWAKVQNFGDLGTFHPAVAKTEILSGANNQTGAVRLLTLQDGGTVKETLTAYDTKAMTYSYVINESVLPVSHYAAKIMVKPTSATTSEVIWTANFARKDPSDTPAKGQDDQSATDTIHAVFQGGLNNLKKITE